MPPPALHDPLPRRSGRSAVAPRSSRPEAGGDARPDAGSHSGAGAGGARLAPRLRPRLHRPRRAEGRLQGRGPLSPAAAGRGGPRPGAGPPAEGGPRALPGHRPRRALPARGGQRAGRPAARRRHGRERARRSRRPGPGLRRARARRGRHLLGLLPPDRLPHRRLVRRAARPVGPRLDAGAPPAPRAGRPHVVAVAGPSRPARPGPRPRAGPRRPHHGLPPPALPRDPHGVGRAAAEEDVAGPHPALGGGRGRGAPALARPAARGPPVGPLAPRRRRHRRRLLGPVALGGRVGPVPHGQALGDGQALRPGPSSRSPATSPRCSWRWAASSPPSPRSATRWPRCSPASGSAASPSPSAPRRRSRTSSARWPSPPTSRSAWATS